MSSFKVDIIIPTSFIPTSPPVTHATMPPPIEGQTYLLKLLKYLDTNKSRLAAVPYGPTPSSSTASPDSSGGAGNLWQQTYTIATLGLDPSSAPLNPTLATLFSLGLSSAAGAPAATQQSNTGTTTKPLTLRLPPDRILYLLLMFQSSSQPRIASSPLIRPTDVPLPNGVTCHPSDLDGGGKAEREGDVASVRSWVGSLRSVGGVFGGDGKGRKSESWTSWFGATSRRKETLDIGTFPSPLLLFFFLLTVREETTLRTLYAALTILPALCIHAPTTSDSRIEDLERQGCYTVVGGLDVRVPLAVFRSLVR
jgi:hypothetical protein